MRALKAHVAANTNAGPAVGAAPTQSALPPAPPAVTAPRQSSKGVVLDMFRDAAGDLDTIEDEWRYGIRDDAQGSDPTSGPPIVIDLDQAA